MAHIVIWNSYCIDDVIVRPSGAHAVAAWVSQFGYNVKVIDFCNHMTVEQLIALTEQFIGPETVAIGASTTFWRDDGYRNWRDPNFADTEEPAWCIACRTILHDKYPTLDWILGGEFATTWRSGRTFHYQWHQFPVPAEDSLLQYLDEKTNAKTTRRLFDITTATHYYTDGLAIQPQEVLSLELARGCQFKCAFCRYPLLGKKKGTYIRDMQLVEQELLSNYERYGTTRYCLVDDTVNESEEKIRALADIATRLPFKLEWVGYNRLDLIASRPDTIDLLRQSGLRSAYFGIESFNPESALVVGKGWNGKHGKDFLLELKDRWKGEITWTLSFIIGLPGETEETLAETQQWCIDNEMFNWYWSPLGISISPHVKWKSTFDKQHAAYGYSFPVPNDPTFWKSKYWNRDLATRAVSAMFTDEYVKAQTVACWSLAEYASTTGKSFNDLMHRKRIDISRDQLLQNVNQLVSNYITLQS